MPTPPQHPSPSFERLQRAFRASFTVMDLAEPLLSLDESAPCSAALDLMRSEGLPILGVRRAGKLTGYVEESDLAGDGDLTSARQITYADLIDETAGIESLLRSLADRDRVFVRVLGDAAAVVGRQDLEKTTMRMWLFGIISLVEMNVSWAMERLYPDDAWTSLVAPARLELAQKLEQERARRGRPTSLLSCLQFSDKLQVLIKEDRHLELLELGSRRKALKLFKQLEVLRNNLAHTQPIVDDNWDAIVVLGTAVEAVVSARGVRRLIES